MDCKKIGIFIAELRKENNLTQQGLAEKLDVTNKAVSKWECGEGYPEITIIPALAEILGVSIDELLKGERTTKDNYRVPPRPSQANKENLSDSHVAYLFQNTLRRFNNLSIISVGLILAGVIFFYTLTLTTYYEMLGFGAQLVFLITGCILYLIAYNNFKNSSIKLYELYGPESQHRYNILEAAKSLEIIIWTGSISVILALPYLFAEDYGYVKSILIFGEYLRIIPVYLAFGGVAAYFIKEIVLKAFIKEWTEKCPSLPSGFASPVPAAPYKKSRLILNAVSAIYGLILLIVLTVSECNRITDSSEALKPMGQILNIGIIIFVLIAAALIIILPIRHNLGKVRPLLSGYALRNLMVCVILGIGISSSIAFSHTYTIEKTNQADKLLYSDIGNPPTDIINNHISPESDITVMRFNSPLPLLAKSILSAGWIFIIFTIALKTAEKSTIKSSAACQENGGV